MDLSQVLFILLSLPLVLFLVVLFLPEDNILFQLKGVPKFFGTLVTLSPVPNVTRITLDAVQPKILQQLPESLSLGLLMKTN